MGFAPRYSHTTTECNSQYLIFKVSSFFNGGATQQKDLQLQAQQEPMLC